MITSVDVCILKPGASHDPRFLVYFLSSKPYLDWMGAIGRGGTRQRISRSELGMLGCAIPSRQEQTEIADYLDLTIAGIDTLGDRCRELIRLSEERRTALISAAVTGEIDVRNAI